MQLKQPSSWQARRRAPHQASRQRSRSLARTLLALAIGSSGILHATAAADGGAAMGSPAGLPSVVLSLAEARARALSLSPELQAAGSAAEAAAGAMRQARAWSNPEIEFEAEDFGADLPGWDESELTWSLAQRLELFGTRGARARAARYDRDAALREAEALRLDLIAEVDRRFAHALAAQARVQAFEESEQIATQLVDAVTALVDAGEVPPIEADRAQAERTGVMVELRKARLDMANTLRALSELWGARQLDFDAVAGPLEITPPLPDRDSLISAEPRVPELRRREAEIARADAALRLATRGRWPELVVHGGVKRLRATDEMSYLGGIGLALPLLDRSGGAIEEARARLSQARAEHAALASRIDLARASAYDALAAALDISRSLREVSLPRARAIYDAVQEGYRRGKTSLLDLIDARRSLVKARLEYIDALESVWSARAELERLLGRHQISPEGESR